MPEPGWYPDDPKCAPVDVDMPSEPSSETMPMAVARAEDRSPRHVMPETVAPASNAGSSPMPASPSVASPIIVPSNTVPSNAATALSDGTDGHDWDGTVLSTVFTAAQPRRVYQLHNESTGQTILIDRATLLGRRPSQSLPEGAVAVRVEDPTRTTSRNHAAVSIDRQGRLWIEDYGSLNGTFIIHEAEELQVLQGAPCLLDAPATLRIGDQFFTLTERAAPPASAIPASRTRPTQA